MHELKTCLTCRRSIVHRAPELWLFSLGQQSRTVDKTLASWKTKIVNKGGTVIFHVKLEQRALEKNPSHLTGFVANAVTKTCGFFISWILQRQLNFTRFWLWDTGNLFSPSTPCSCIGSPHHKADLWAMGHTPSAGWNWVSQEVQRSTLAYLVDYCSWRLGRPTCPVYQLVNVPSSLLSWLATHIWW